VAASFTPYVSAIGLTGPVTEKIMVFGQAPCSAGRMKRRNVSYLGLLPAAKDRVSDITELYVARYGEPKPGEKVFIVLLRQPCGVARNPQRA
jgi:hypothetical protein